MKTRMVILFCFILLIEAFIFVSYIKIGGLVLAGTLIYFGLFVFNDMKLRKRNFDKNLEIRNYLDECGLVS